MNLPVLKKDKANHFIYGLIIFGIVNFFLGAIVAGIICLVFAVGKEIYDYLNKDKHTPDVMDAIITIVGGIIGFLISIC